MSEAQVPARARDGRVDVLRGVAILLVLFHHFNIAYPLQDTVLSSLLGWDLVRDVARNGNYGVTMFFAVSGFLITSNAQRRWGTLSQVRLTEFYGLRAARILPCLILLLAVVNLLGAGRIAIFRNQPEFGDPVSVLQVDVAALTFRMNVLMAHAGWVNYALCVLWSLSVEEVFYLTFPILCRIIRRTQWIVAFWCLFIVVGPLWRLAHQDDDSGYLYAYLACFDGIAIGCCAAVLSRAEVTGGIRTLALQAGVTGAMVFLYLFKSIGQANVYGVTLMAVGTAVLIGAPRPGQRQLGVRRGRILSPLRRCGQLSYELYLFHLVVLGGLRSVWLPVASTGNARLLLFVAYLVGSAILAIMIEKLYSRPLNDMLRRRLRIARAGLMGDVSVTPPTDVGRLGTGLYEPKVPHRPSAIRATK